MKNVIALGVVGLAASCVSADPVRVEITGSWDFGNLRSGPLNGINSGDVSMSFDLDSTSYVDSSTFPVRGYFIDPASFVLTAGGVTVGMPASIPSNRVPLFVVRDNDPAVDGFYLSSFPVDAGFPNGVLIDNAGLLDQYVSTIFQATYAGDRLSSLNIEDAAGTYDFTGLQVFNWGIEDGGLQPVGWIFDQFTITVIPAPGVLAAVAPLGLAAVRRRR